MWRGSAGEWRERAARCGERIAEAFCALRGVEVDGGEHHVVWVHRANSQVAGGLIAVLCAAMGLMRRGKMREAR